VRTVQLPADLQLHDGLEAFHRRHRVALLALLFTDIVDSTRLKQRLGDSRAVMLIQQHHTVLRELLATFDEAEEIETAGDSFFLVFTKPSDAVRFALQFQRRIRALAKNTGEAILDRVGIHVGEVYVQERGLEHKAKDLYGLQVDTCARVMSLGRGDQILLTRAAFDSARQMLRGEDFDGLAPLAWLNHGAYSMKGVEDPVEVCEVGERELAVLQPPADNEKALRHVSPDSEPVLGWRPAVGQIVPDTAWRLEEKLGEGGFGEVWLATHTALHQQRVIKFCFRADRVRSLQREVTLFRLIRDRVGEHAHVARLYDVFFEQPPFYLVTDYAAGRDLVTWCQRHGGIAQVPFAVRLEIVAQIAEALQAAQDTGIVHRDVKPSNILLQDRELPAAPARVRALLGDFGIGQVTSPELVAGISRAGFSMTVRTSGSVTGTLAYLAPELAAGQPATPRSDIYSLGVVLLQLIIGDFSRPLTTDWTEAVDDPLLRADLALCFAGQPAQRFAGAGELARRLRALPERRAQQEAEEVAQRVRERAAQRRGMMRVAAYASVLVLVFAALSGWAWQQTKLARRTGAELLEETKSKEQESSDRLTQWQRAEDALTLLELRETEREFESQQGPQAVARLAGLVRRQPGNTRAVQRLASVFAHSAPSGERLVREFIGEAGALSANFSPDGRRIVTTCADNSARIWDAVTGQPLTGPLKHEGPIKSASFSPDGTRVVTASHDSTATIWEVSTGKALIKSLQHDDRVNFAGFSPDGRYVVTASDDKKARIWDAITGQLVSGPLKHAGSVRFASFSPDGRQVVTASWDKTAQVWSATNALALSKAMPHEGSVAYACFSPDGRRVVTASYDYSARVWEAGTGQPVTNLLKHDSLVLSARFSPDGRFVVTASMDNTARVWDATSGQASTTPLKHKDAVRSASFSPEGCRVVTGSDDGTARVWDATTGQPLTGPFRHGGPVTSATFSPDGRLVLTTSGDRTIRLWDATPGRPLTEPLRHEGGVISAGFSPEGRLVVTASYDNTARVWDAITGRSLTKALQHEDRVNSASFSPDGRRIVTTSDDQTARIWEAATGQPVTGPLKHDDSVIFASFSPDGLRLATASNDGTARVWRAETGELLPGHFRHGRGVNSVRFSPDGNRIVTASDDKTAQIWNTNGQPVMGPFMHEDSVHSASFSPDGLLVVTASFDGVAKIWNAAPGKSQTNSLRHAARVYSAGFSPDGHSVVTAAYDNTALVWDAFTGRPLTNPMQHKGAKTGSQTFASFSPDGSRVVTASHDGTARVWDAATGQPLTEPLPHDDYVNSASFSPDGRRVITASEDKTARIWDVPDYTGKFYTVSGHNDLVLTLAEYAEAYVGLRTDDGRLFSPSTNRTDAVLTRARPVFQKAESAQAILLRWLDSPPLDRAISPFSPITVREWLDRRRQEDTVESLHQVLLYEPNNGVVAAHLAFRLTEVKDEQDKQRREEAVFFANHALSLSPDDPEVRRLCGEVTRVLGLR
jgi:WD40 repeat protein/serine/threonine protein kinase/class 3 adenylate cyclase